MEHKHEGSAGFSHKQMYRHIYCLNFTKILIYACHNIEGELKLVATNGKGVFCLWSFPRIGLHLSSYLSVYCLVYCYPHR